MTASSIAYHRLESFKHVSDNGVLTKLVLSHLTQARVTNTNHLPNQQSFAKSTVQVRLSPTHVSTQLCKGTLMSASYFFMSASYGSRGLVFTHGQLSGCSNYTTVTGLGTNANCSGQSMRLMTMTVGCCQLFFCQLLKAVNSSAD